MVIFHYSEFLSIAVCNPKSLTPSSYMLNHSVAYGVAAATSWLEYLLWHSFLPGNFIITIYIYPSVDWGLNQNVSNDFGCFTNKIVPRLLFTNTWLMMGCINNQYPFRDTFIGPLNYLFSNSMTLIVFRAARHK